MTTADLITIETLKAADVFKPGAVEKLISDVEAKVRAIPAADHTTEKGRNEIKALAYKVTRSKTALDDMGKTFVAELKKAAGVVDADRRIIRERLETLKDEVRKPVTEYEAIETLRIDAHTQMMEKLLALDIFEVSAVTIDAIDQRWQLLLNLKARDWQEFSDGANRIIPKMDVSLRSLRARVIKEEQDRAEFERLREAEAERREVERKANAERERQERDKQIADIARREIEAVAQARENERLAAIARAERAEAEAKESAARAEQAKSLAVKKAEQDRQDAIAAERKRVADAKAAEEAATKKREANTKHLAKINNAALASLVKIKGLEVDIAKAVIIAIASGKVAHVKIEY